MTPTPRVGAGWQNLGQLLIRRRVQINPRYSNRSEFCRSTGLDPRVVADIEKARRTNFSQPIIAALEHAYQLPPGWIHQATQDPNTELPPLPGATTGPSGQRHAPEPFWRHPPADLPDDIIWEGLPSEAMQAWHIEGLSVEERRTVMVVVCGLVAQRHHNRNTFDYSSNSTTQRNVN